MLLTGNATGLALVSSAQNKIINNFVSQVDAGIILSNGCSNNMIPNNLPDGNTDQFGGGAGIVNSPGTGAAITSVLPDSWREIQFGLKLQF